MTRISEIKMQHVFLWIINFVRTGKTSPVHLHEGKPLDSTDEGVPLDWETTALFISRLNLFADTIQEMKSENQFNLRFPLDIFSC